MAKGVKLSCNKKASINKDIATYTKPSHVYIPLISQNDTNITSLVKKGDYVYIGTIIGKRKGTFRIPILSSVSGTVTGFEEKYSSCGNLVKCVVIKNDFKEAKLEDTKKRKNINKLSKDEFIDIIRERGIIGMSGTGFPTYVKYENNNDINTLIINAVECEPYITSDYALLKEHPEEILDAIDAILDINHIKCAYIAIKKKNTELIKILNNFIGTYLKIKIVTVPDLYPMGWERTLVKQIMHKNYKKLPLEIGVVVNNVSTIHAIYEALTNDKPLTERIVTFSGNMIEEPQNILVKNGTLVSEVIAILGGYKQNNDIYVIAGGPMMGLSVPTEDLVITSDLNNVLINKKMEEEPEKICIKCGKCAEVCPVKLSPNLIRKNINKPKVLAKLQPSRCIECGLCTYVCPARINLREYIKQAKKTLSKEEK